jgi:hypothetical protein
VNRKPSRSTVAPIATAIGALKLAAITLALGATYWLIRERDDRGAPAAGNFS